MTTRFLTASALLVGASACSPDVDQPQAEEGAEMVECALGEGSAFGPDCLVERENVDGQKQLIVRHPDGGFRRFAQLDDGRGLVELDGADQLTRALDGNVLEISVGADRYRFTANVSGQSNLGAQDAGADDAAE
ncbi:hypothetical protein QWY75_03480 [Pontixanthobacter aestiaquae]|uniref:Lipoprotein n=1 Tax=Pontixanthobacter aestiaquae TaxID=1509367 RepID=A0A844Z4Y4_9SPHN|nr:hypothetical protein [Pontixanthobacter aestiaquae]MDN3645267.1 hypothetical protein [Pontixanthobacter aestiaquae]MXO83731.1 hypothetical protein [Pontixanthobacter aestiaquae]